jgi:tRNA A-37 threonylcarbamoyl transferase component Bud32
LRLPDRNPDGAYNRRVVNRFATGRDVAQRRLSRDGTSRRWLWGIALAALAAAAGLGATAVSGGSVSSTTTANAESAASNAANRLSTWVSEVGNELDDYAAAIVLDSSPTPGQLASQFQTLLTETSDFWLLELTDRSGRVLAASNGTGLDLSGAPWLSTMSATPLLTPVTPSGNATHPITWLMARQATAGDPGPSGFLVGALQVSQLANWLGPVVSGTAPGTVVQAVLPGGMLLYSSAMTTTLHAGLTDSAMVGDGALRQRVSSPAVEAALSGRTGVITYTAGGVTTAGGYARVALPGWILGVVATEPAAPAGFGWAWPAAVIAAALGLALLGGLARGLPRTPWRGPAGTAREPEPGPASPLSRLLPGDRGRHRGAPLRPALDAADSTITVVHRDGGAATGRPAGRRRLRGRYEILEVTGSGGEGQVLRALDHLHARQVAIKVRALDPRDATRRREILNEASVLLRMTPHAHASVVREDFIIGDRYYLVMDWIDGMPLNRLLAQSGAPGLPLETVLGWMGQVAEVLDHLHAHSPPIVHGDVKPSNVIVASGADRRAVLVDFGISRQHVAVAAEGAAPSAAVGSPGFMAPEMLRGAPPTPACDVFGLAATTFALLLGEPPRLGGSPDWTVIKGARTGIVEAAFRAALAADPAHRPASARAFVDSLRAGDPVSLPLSPTAIAGP